MQVIEVTAQEVEEGSTWRSAEFVAQARVHVGLQFDWNDPGASTTVAVSLVDSDTDRAVPFRQPSGGNATLMNVSLPGGVAQDYQGSIATLSPGHSYYVLVSLGNPGGGGLLGISGRVGVDV